jgi:nitroimidazol reductase NimA-like FMN-containing flavoprotein (pyridoxamine 5'-phosphate oxidase superfamily)
VLAVPTDTHGLLVLSRSDCLDRVARDHLRLGRIAFTDGEDVIVLPVNFVWHDQSVVFRTDAGAKLQAAADDRLTFQLDAIDPAWREGWSVLIRGHARVVTEEAEIRALERLPLRPWAPGDKSHFVRLFADDVSGREIP